MSHILVGHVTSIESGGNKMESASFHHFYFTYMTFFCHYNYLKMIVNSFDMNIDNLTPPTYLCTYPPTHLLTYLFTYLTTHPSMNLSTYPPTYPPIHPPTHDPPTYLPNHPPTYLATYLPTYLLLIYHPTICYIHHSFIVI
jgi:hypothetical protein